MVKAAVMRTTRAEPVEEMSSIAEQNTTKDQEAMVEQNSTGDHDVMTGQTHGPAGVDGLCGHDTESLCMASMAVKET